MSNEATAIGRTWVTQYLKPEQAQRIAALVTGYDEAARRVRIPDARGEGEAIYCAWAGVDRDDWDRTSMESLMQDMFGDECNGYPTFEMCHEFVVGVAEMLEEQA